MLWYIKAMVQQDTNCVFCKIVAGEVPAEIIEETDDTLTFLDMEPVNPGHALVIPKEHIDRVDELPDGLYQKVMQGAKTVSRRIQKVFNPQRVGMMVHGFDIPHAHVHVIPMHSRHDLGVGHKSKASAEELAQVGQQLRE